MAYIRLKYNRETLRDYAQLLTRSEITKLVNEGDYSTLNHFIHAYDSRVFSSGKNYGDYYCYIYDVLRTHYGNEYVVKNEFINYGLHQLNLCSDYQKIYIYSELRIGDVIADLALFNGHSVGIEIKTELDSPNRLDSQLDRYLRVFNSVYVMVPRSCLSIYQPFTSKYPIGLISYSSQERTFKIEKNSIRCSELDPKQVMEVLHTAEYKKIVHRYYGICSIEGRTDFNQFTLYGKKLSQIPANELNKLFIEVLKERGVPISFFKRKRKELNQALLALRSNDDFRKKLYNQLLKPISLK